MHINENYFATCPQFVEDLLAGELRELGASSVKITAKGVHFKGPPETVYKACLYSRIAGRILLPLADFTADSREDVYNRALQIPWLEHFGSHNSFAIDCTLKDGFTHNSNYAALVLKDAVADYFRQQTGTRPSVKTDLPDILIHLHINRQTASIYLDLSGASLHRREYRTAGSPATLKEHTAAGLLYRAGWKELARSGYAFMDLMCGSGTLLIEAAFMAAHIPPRIKRTHYGFLHWKMHDASLWKQLTEEAAGRVNLEQLTPVVGYDADKRAVHAALANVEEAGLSGKIHIERRDISQATHPAHPAFKSGLVAINPPYGIRLGKTAELKGLYKEIGTVLLNHFPGWKATVITADKELSYSLGLRAVKTNWLYNGAIKCLLTHFEINPGRILTPHREQDAAGVHKEKLPPGNINHAPPLAAGTGNAAILSAGKSKADFSPAFTGKDDMLVNRLKKNLKHLGKWAKRNDITCYRLYDADLPEYAAAVDYYEKQWLQIQEYAPPPTIDPRKARERLLHLIAVCREILELPAGAVYLKQRKTQKGSSQYQQLSTTRDFRIIREGDFRFKVNFSDYLDTGIFLDNRLLREHLKTNAAGRHFLNLFSYTGTATVYALAGAALSATAVDTNQNYHQWALENLELNNLAGKKHEFVRADCLEWLKLNNRKYDLIYLDPPTFSNTGKKGLIFDLQKQHVELIKLCLSALTNRGMLIFSTNFRKFKLDCAALAGYAVKDLSRSTLPEDFRRKPGMHKGWQIEFPG